MSTSGYTDSRGGSEKPPPEWPVSRIVRWVVAATLILVAVLWAGLAGCQVYNRYQARQNADNSVQIAEINTQKENKIIALTKQKARQRVQEAIGIRRAQQIIDATLTPLYVQHEAIQAQLKMANSPNHTTVYIPSGSNGVPLINDVGPGAAASK